MIPNDEALLTGEIHYIINRFSLMDVQQGEKLIHSTKWT